MSFSPGPAEIEGMDLSSFIFTGFNRRVAALDRFTGAVIWQWKAPKGSSYVSLLLEPDLLVVSVDGYMYGLDPLTGGELWFNPMTGFGTGVTSLASRHGVASPPILAVAAAEEERRRRSSSSTTSNP